MTPQGSPRIIAAVNHMVRASRQLLLQTGREPTEEELAARLALPVENVRKLREIAMTPVRG